MSTASAATAEPGVLGVLTHLNAPKLAWPNDPEVAVLQSDEVAFHGQFVGAVVAESIEIARYAAGLVTLEYERRPVDVDLRADRDDLLKPQHAAIFGSQPGDLQDGSPADSAVGDFEAGMDAATHTLDATYSTPIQHQQPDGAAHRHRRLDRRRDHALLLLAGRPHAPDAAGERVRLDASRIRVISPHVGGAFGSKVFPVTWATLAFMGAQLVPGRPVKFALTRQQMFTLVGYRPATIQRIRLGADADGRLVALGARCGPADGQGQAVRRADRGGEPADVRRAAPAYDHPAGHPGPPGADDHAGPGEATGMFALESAMDEMAVSPAGWTRSSSASSTSPRSIPSPGCRSPAAIW